MFEGLFKSSTGVSEAYREVSVALQRVFKGSTEASGRRSLGRCMAFHGFFRGPRGLQGCARRVLRSPRGFHEVSGARGFRWVPGDSMGIPCDIRVASGKSQERLRVSQMELRGLKWLKGCSGVGVAFG